MRSGVWPGQSSRILRHRPAGDASRRTAARAAGRGSASHDLQGLVDHRRAVALHDVAGHVGVADVEVRLEDDDHLLDRRLGRRRAFSPRPRQVAWRIAANSRTAPISVVVVRVIRLLLSSRCGRNLQGGTRRRAIWWDFANRLEPPPQSHQRPGLVVPLCDFSLAWRLAKSILASCVRNGHDARRITPPRWCNPSSQTLIGRRVVNKRLAENSRLGHNTGVKFCTGSAANSWPVRDVHCDRDAGRGPESS